MASRSEATNAVCVVTSDIYQNYHFSSVVVPWVETGAGILMTGMLLTPLAAPAALFIATVGAISVFKAVYIDRRELKCACVGGNSNVPLGFVSLTENLMMIGMAIVMLVQIIV